jgi:hypothetical protein
LPWDDRATFFNAITAAPLENYAAMADLLLTEDERDAFTEFAALGMMRAIGLVLHGLGTTEPIVGDGDLVAACALSALSLDPAHRRAARQWIAYTDERTPAVFFAEAVAERRQALAVFFNLVEATLPGAGQAWGRAMPTTSGRARP